MSSKTRKLLEDLGIDANRATKLTMYLNHEDGKEMPDDLNDFSYEKSIQSIKGDFEELVISNRKETWAAEHDKATHGKKWNEFSQPIIQFAKKEGGFAKEQVEGKSPKEVLQMLVEVKNKAIVSASSTMDDSHLTKITTLQDEKQFLLDEIEAIKMQTASQIEAAKKGANQQIYEFHTKGYINKRMRSNVVAFDYDSKIDFYAESFIPKIMSNYVVDYQSGKISMPDGTRAVAFDKNGFYDNVDQAIAALAKQYGCIKLSNGDQAGVNASDRSHFQHQGKTVSAAGVNFLKDMMSK